MSVIVSLTPGADEEDGDSPVTIQLSAPSSELVSLAWTTLAYGSATTDWDYTDRSGTISIIPGLVSAVIDIDNDFDQDAEADEFIEVEFYSLVNGTFDGGQLWQRSLAWILDNDGTEQDRAIGVTNPIVVEDDTGQRFATFTISLSRALDRDIQLNYATRDGSALAGQDYTQTTGQVSFLAGQTLATVQVPILGGVASEGREGFDLIVTPTADFSSAGFGHIGTAAILDDDSGDARPTLSVEVQDTPEYGGLYFAVRLSAASSESVTVQYIANTGSALPDDDFDAVTTVETLTFAPGETVRYLRIGTEWDDETELDESVILELFNPFNAALTGGAATLTQVGWILDDDGLTQKRAVTVTGTDIREPGPGETAQVIFTIELSRPSSETLTFAYETVNGSARAGQDYTARTGSVTFAPGQTTQQIAVTVTGDTGIEALENFFLRLLAPFPAAVGSGAATAIGTAEILDGAIVGTAFPDSRVGTARADAIYGLAGDDDLFGGGGHDFINAGTGGDEVFGGTGNDTILGEGGDDSIQGGDGADRMTGGAGRDRLSGGVDALQDIFIFDDGHSTTGRRRDVIERFDSGEDRIDLERIDANRDRAGDQDFGDFLGRKSASFVEQNALWVVDTGRDLVLRAEVNGDGRVDFEIRLVSLDSLRAGDILG